MTLALQVKNKILFTLEISDSSVHSIPEPPLPVCDFHVPGASLEPLYTPVIRLSQSAP